MLSRLVPRRSLFLKIMGLQTTCVWRTTFQNQGVDKLTLTSIGCISTCRPGPEFANIICIGRRFGDDISMDDENDDENVEEGAEEAAGKTGGGGARAGGSAGGGGHGELRGAWLIKVPDRDEIFNIKINR